MSTEQATDAATPDAATSDAATSDAAAPGAAASPEAPPEPSPGELAIEAALKAVGAIPATSDAATGDSEDSGSTDVAAPAAALEAPRRVRKPMIVTAVVVGLALVATPLVLSRLNDDPEASGAPTAAGYPQDPSAGAGSVPAPAGGPIDQPTPAAQSAGVAPVAGAVPGPGSQVNPAPVAPQAGRPAQSGAPAPVVPPVNPPATPRQAAGPTYEATAGPGCGGTTGYSSVGSFRSGKEGWVDHGGGCGAAYVSVPMSGWPDKDDDSAYGLWTFNTGPVTTGTCAVSVYVPAGDLVDVGGDPTSYRVHDRFDVGKGGEVGAFEVKQVARRGQWVEAGTFRIGGAKLAVKLLSRGKDWSDSGSKTYAHHAAAAVKVKCQA
ncbi:hypothetical protein [Actinokineospora sp. NBRC 105648]|uniref:hypothetical protein n=1 Tax=Actinokineospora sp. NBRC 105648 TaxID=3032206 RepID=UPI0024A19257|nr:hypothetical protein [Actinokineospora sp. NBRC 105648]GLZ42550.1 hypothetical protein Acsp05_61740 [Actinokineospora sp. NBRC 105648]